jgi:hypothetical protein
MRQRLEDANGTAANQVIFISNSAGADAMALEALTRIEQWLAAIHTDTAPGTAAEKVLRNRPTDLRDACWTSPTTRTDEVFGYQLAARARRCSRPSATCAPAARRGVTGDTRKCQLKPLDFASYPVTFTAAKQTRPQAPFPTGVWDWTKPGVDERPPLGTWLDYGP